MHILVFFGSARKQGNTAELLQMFLKGTAEGPQVTTEIIDAYTTPVAPCRDCRWCWKHPGCCIDDYAQVIYGKIEQADLIVFATPVYFHSVPAPLKTIIDRFQTYWASTVRKDRPAAVNRTGVLLLTGGAPAFPHQFTGTQMVLEGALKELNASVDGILTASATDRVPVSQQTGLLAEAFELGSRLARRQTRT
ncbi:MAG: flavodoxin family protein [Spirochaetia bacterium]|nr:flavodoxin family protein [Spirochaetia bacterium]